MFEPKFRYFASFREAPMPRLRAGRSHLIGPQAIDCRLRRYQNPIKAAKLACGSTFSAGWTIIDPLDLIATACHARPSGLPTLEVATVLDKVNAAGQRFEFHQEFAVPHPQFAGRGHEDELRRGRLQERLRHLPSQ